MKPDTGKNAAILNSVRYSGFLKKRPVVLLGAMMVVAVMVIMLAFYGLKRVQAQNTSAGKEAQFSKANTAIPVRAALVLVKPMPIWIRALGTVTPRKYVNVMPRVSGLLLSVDYQEGQPVRAGQLLATIDPKPFRIQVEQARAQLQRDHAQLDGAKGDLKRYEVLQVQDSIARQQVDDQRALVKQLAGTVATDKAALDNANLQLSYTRITAPISGIAGLRQVDAGNMVNTNGSIGGSAGNTASATSSLVPIVTIAQVQPIQVTFSIPQTDLPQILDRLRQGASLEVQAWNQRNSQSLATGKLVAVDNQINTSTGTVALRAEFANPGMVLFPNQFVNVQLLVNTVAHAVVIPSAAIAIGAPGSYVYVIGSDDKVTLRKVDAGASENDETVILKGLKPGERVVTDGLDRLKDGAKVHVITLSGQKAVPLGHFSAPGQDTPSNSSQKQGKGA